MKLCIIQKTCKFNEEKWPKQRRKWQWRTSNIRNHQSTTATNSGSVREKYKKVALKSWLQTTCWDLILMSTDGSTWRSLLYQFSCWCWSSTLSAEEARVRLRLNIIFKKKSRLFFVYWKLNLCNLYKNLFNLCNYFL